MTQNLDRSAATLHTGEVLALAVSCGLLAGLGEGAGLYFLQNGPLAGETINTTLAAPNIFYVSPVIDLVMFSVLGVLLAAVCRRWRALPQSFSIFVLLAFLLTFDWLSLLLDRVLDPAVIVVLSAGVGAALARGCVKHAGKIVRLARRSLPALAAVVAALAIGLPGREMVRENRGEKSLPRAAPGAPNVVILVMDTVRADRVSALGYSRPTTPNFDRLAAQGVLFEKAFSTSSWTLPAHASLLTGRLPFEHGAEKAGYDGRYPSLAQYFLSQGYRTAAFSGNEHYFTRENGFGAGFLHFDGLATNLVSTVSRPFYCRQLIREYQERTRSDMPGRKSAEEINARFLRWLEKDRSRPFFVVFNYFDSHAPYLPPAPYRGRFARRPDAGGILNFLASRETLKNPQDIGDESDAYDGAISYEDAQLGRLFEALQERDLTENTLLVILSDHGEFFGEHGLFLHRNALFLEGIHVPLMLRWTGHIPAGVRVRAPASIASLAATVTALVPGATQSPFPGTPLTALWDGSAATTDRAPVLSELVGRGPASDGGPPRRTESVLTARWHFLTTRGKNPQLYDWDADPGEEKNLAQSPEGMRVVEMMKTCVQVHLAFIRQPECGLPRAQVGALADATLPAESRP
jgi:arylsulfatase A-like enzyme